MASIVRRTTAAATGSASCSPDADDDRVVVAAPRLRVALVAEPRLLALRRVRRDLVEEGRELCPASVAVRVGPPAAADPTVRAQRVVERGGRGAVPAAVRRLEDPVEPARLAQEAVCLRDGSLLVVRAVQLERGLKTLRGRERCGKFSVSSVSVRSLGGVETVVRRNQRPEMVAGANIDQGGRGEKKRRRRRRRTEPASFVSQMSCSCRLWPTCALQMTDGTITPVWPLNSTVATASRRWFFA